MDDGSKPNIGKRAFQQEPPSNKNPIFEDNESDDLEEEENSACGGGGGGEVDADGCKKKRGSFRRGCGGAVVAPQRCQAEKCGADLRDAKRYHRRHKVCEVHAKAPVVLVTGLQQRFCQQCSRFHELSEFDEAKKSCRRRLAGHNERRRKSSSELNGEGSSRRGANPQLKESQCRQADERGRVQIKIPENSTCKHFQIR